MIRILHIARYAKVSTERRVALMAAEPGFTFRLVRPTPRGGSFDRDAVRSRSLFEDVRSVPMWRVDDPHRCLYLTPTFGLRAAAPDVVHVEEEPDSLAALHVAVARRALRPDARLVLHTWQNVNRPKRPWVEWVLRRTLAAADAVVCGNDDAVPILRQMGFSGPAPVIQTLALDASVFYRRPVPRLSDGFTVGYFGRLVPEKGIDTLVRAVARIGNPALLVIAGSGPSRAGIEALVAVQGLGGRVRFLGDRNPGEVAALMCGVDVVAVPSRSTPVWKEQFGRVLVEAMGCGVPVVASDSGAIPAVVGDAGLIFPEDDVDALAHHLRSLRESEVLRRDLGRRGHERALVEHAPARRAAQTIDFYRQLVDGS